MGAIIEAIRSLPAAAAYAIISGLVFSEAALFVGFVLPGEAAVLLGGFLASTHHLNIVALCVLVTISAIVGDSIGYEVGKHFGPRVLSAHIFDRHRGRLDSAQQMLRDRGGPAVLLGRFTAFFRAVMPGLAGLSQMRYRTFLCWNALGGLTWGVGFCLIGYLAGRSYEEVAKTIGRDSAGVVILLTLAGLVVWQVRKRRRGDDSGGEDRQSTGSV